MALQRRHSTAQRQLRAADGVAKSGDVQLHSSSSTSSARPCPAPRLAHALPCPAVLNAVGGAVAGMDADLLFRERGCLVDAIQGGLESVLCGHGFALSDCLITARAPSGWPHTATMRGRWRQRGCALGKRCQRTDPRAVPPAAAPRNAGAGPYCLSERSDERRQGSAAAARDGV